MKCSYIQTSVPVFPVTWVLAAMLSVMITADGKWLGVGDNGKFRLCVVESRGSYRKAGKFCPILDAKDSDIQCVVGMDRLDCLRRIAKGTVDFGVFSAEDLVAARWAAVEVLVTNELRFHDSPFEFEVVAVVNNAAGISTAQDLRDSRLCHPGHGYETDWTDILANYFESTMVPRQCNPEMTLTENRLKAASQYFSAACKAGPWVPDPERDRELKSRYPSLCSLCYSPRSCSAGDKFWGRRGPLYCLTDGQGEVAWARLDDVKSHFGFVGIPAESDPKDYSLLCPDGHLQPLDTKHPCVWIAKPWPAVAAKRTSATAIQNLVSKISHDDLDSWESALLNLLETHHVNVTTLSNVVTIDDYLDQAAGFQGAYSFAGCNPPRSISVCTTSLSALAKCSWLQEAGAVQGVEPNIHCMRRDNVDGCVESVQNRESDITLVGEETRVRAERDHNLTPILFESTNIFGDYYVTVAVVRADSNIQSFSELRGKKACFSSYEGTAWYSVIDLLKNESFFSKNDCSYEQEIGDFFGKVCAPGAKDRKLTSLCKGGRFETDVDAFRCLADGHADVAFISLNTVLNHTDGASGESWTKNLQSSDFRTLCRQGTDTDSSRTIQNNPCYVTWASRGALMINKNVTQARKHEIFNTIRHVDNLFGKHFKAYTPSFTLYGPYDYKKDVLFHDSTERLQKIDDLTRYKREGNFEKIVPRYLPKCLNSYSNSSSAVLRGCASVLAYVIPLQFMYKYRYFTV